MRGLYWIVAVGVGAACSSDPFQCASDVQCVQGDVQGQCLGLGSCAFPDPECASGLRFADHAVDSAGECVPVLATSTGTIDASSSSSTSASPGSTSSATVAVDGTSSSSTGPAMEESSSTGEPLDPDLVVWYRFEPPDLYADAGPLGLDAACARGQCPPAAVDRGAQFDGVDDSLQIEAGAMLDLPPPWTVTVWVRRDADAGGVFRSVVAKPVGIANANSWEIGMNSAQWFLGTASNGINTPWMPIGEWTHFALSYDGSTMTAFENAASIGSVLVDDIPYDMQPMLIGSDIDQQVVDNFFPGTIDDVRVYARALDESELAAVIERTRGDG